MNIGKPQKEIIIEPLEEPVSVPDTEPEREKEPVPA